MKNTKAVTVLVLVGTGSKYETKENNGISHFLEHMFFKGTKKRPNSLAINETIDSIGGQNNAFTGKEMTGYWAKIDGKHLNIVLDWVSDIFLNSKIEQKEINKEKGVILEELNMYLDEPKRYVLKLWDVLLYGDQPAGRLILGDKEIIKKINRQDFLKYQKEHYTSKNTIVVVSGNINQIKNLEFKIKNYFKNIKTREAKDKKKVIEKQKEPGVLLSYKKTDQTHFILGVRAYDIFNEDKYILAVLATILGQGMSSRLFIDIRDKHGLAYYVRTITDEYTDSGYLFTRAGVDNNRIDLAIKIVLKHYKLIKNQKIGEKELRKAKEFIRGGTILSMEGSDEQAEFYGTQELLENKILTLDEKLAKIDSVTADDIQRVAKDIFRPEKLNLALIGPFKDRKRFEKMLKL